MSYELVMLIALALFIVKQVVVARDQRIAVARAEAMRRHPAGGRR